MTLWNKYDVTKYSKYCIYHEKAYVEVLNNRYQKQDKSGNPMGTICQVTWRLSNLGPYGKGLIRYEPIICQLCATFMADLHVHIYANEIQ